MERIPASDNPDVATQQTVEVMCRYIRTCADDDPLLRLFAQWALQQYGGGSEDPASKAWAAFWFAKHLVRFRSDEVPMFRAGMQGSQDWLESPSVLIRTAQPREDCDGFTMLVCSFLRAMGVDYCIVTVAASPDDPQRFSHVFCMALLPTGPLPLDASHGSGPGWMVPKDHTFRWQCWDSDGNQVQIARPRDRGLHGWARPGGLGRVGLGDPCDPTADDYDMSICLAGANSYVPPPNTQDVSILPNALPTGVPTTSSSTPASLSNNLTSFLNTLAVQAAGVAKVAEAPFINPATASAASFASIMPILGIGLAALLVFGLLGSKK